MNAVRAGLPRLLCALAGVSAALAAQHVLPASASELWSAPARLSSCSAPVPMRVLFPSDGPTHATGPGAVVWGDGADCAGGEGTRISALGAADVPVAAAQAASGGLEMPAEAAAASGGTPAVLGLRDALAADGPRGQVVIAGISKHRDAPQLIEGVAGTPLSALGVADDAQAPLALASAYLGDVALAAAQAGGRGGLRARVERHYAHSYGSWQTVSPSGAVSAPTLALDYRSDLLAVWQQAGALYARDLPASGAAGPIQRLASAAPTVRVAALRSDDNRAIVAWSEQRADATSVYLDQSGADVRFGRAQLLERFENPEGLATPAASPALVRLRSESVMLAWAGAAGGHWVLRTAPVDQLGVRSVGTITAPLGDALLAGLAPGPDGGALALWSEPLPGADGLPDPREQALAAARGVDDYPGRTSFGPRELLAPPGPIEDPAVALDPRSGRALAVWRAGAGGVYFAIRAGGGAP